MAYFTNAQAEELWIARWMGATVQSLIAKYGENTFRLYEVWTEKKNAGTRLPAFERLKFQNPDLASRTDPSPHVEKRRVVYKSPDGQLDLFD